MDNHEIEELIDKYRAGTVSEEEKALLEAWYLSQDIDAIADLRPEEFAEDLLLIGDGLPLQKAGVKTLWWPSIAAVAACLAVFLLVYLAWPARQDHPLAVLTVAAHQEKQVTLADGSQVWVNSGSELKYPKTFPGKTREVELSGEAYFDIRHDAAKPFIIHTGQVLTTVLGTAFNIKEDKNTHIVVVTVTRGKVSVASGGRQLAVLTPNEQISFNTDSKKSDRQTVDASRVAGWQKTDLQFEDITFAEAARQLEQKFKVRISFANDKLKDCRFTGASLTGDKLEDVLKTICDFNHATYRRQPDGSMLISGPGCDN